MSINQFARAATMFVITTCLFLSLPAQASARYGGCELAGPDTEKAEAVDKVCDQMADILTGLQRGDIEPLSNLLPSKTRERGINDLGRSYWMHVGAFGPLETFSVVGGTHDEKGRIQAIARMNFANKSTLFRFVWYENQLLTFNPVDDPAEILANSTR